VFLDEIGDTTPALQVKLLRVLQEHEVRPVGSPRAVSVDARVVAATNVDLERAVAEHRFRHDLYYRLSVVVISLPPLRERRGDIPLLIQQFLHASSARRGRIVAMTADAIEALTRYDWPGNVRELENTIERLVVFSRGDIDVGDLPPMITAARPLEERVFEGLPTLDELERRYLIHVLEAVGGNRTRAAEALVPEPFANHDHMLDTRRHRHLVELRQQAGIDDDRPVPGMLDDMREIAGVQANVQRVKHGPHRGHRKVRLQVLTTVPGQRRDTIAGTDAEIPERACELLRPSQHVGIPVAMDRGAVAIDNRPLAEKHGRPPDDRRHRQLVIHVRPAVPPPQTE